MHRTPFSRSFALTLPALLAIACGGEDPETFREPGEVQHIAVWIEADPLIPRAAVMDACNEWDPMHLACHEAADRDDADVSVAISDEDCANTVINGRPAVAIMRAEGKRRISMFSQCLSKRRERIPDDVDWGVFVQGNIKHEFGHVLGIRGHIPYFCDGTDDLPIIIHPSGVALCGPANMNAANYLPRATPLTELDFLRMDVRSSGFLLPRDEAPLFPAGHVAQLEQALTDDFTCVLFDY